MAGLTELERQHVEETLRMVEGSAMREERIFLPILRALLRLDNTVKLLDETLRVLRKQEATR